MSALFILPIVATLSLAFATFAFMSGASTPARGACLTLAAIGALLTSATARAQTYDPNYPVCMQIYGPVGYLDCRYASLDQCKYLAVGRSASCVVNPYFAKAPVHLKRHREL